MDIYDKNKIGRLIAWGGEHFVYNYDIDKVIKFSSLYFFLGSKAKEKATRDYEVCKQFFGTYLLHTECAISANKKYIVHIQPKIQGRFLVVTDLENIIIKQQFKEILNGYYSMIQNGHAEVDFIGRGGVFRKCLSNIFVTNDNNLVIIDATLLEVNESSLLQPIVFILRKIVLLIQNATIKMFLQKLS